MASGKLVAHRRATF